ncbi:cation transport ATPase [Inhella inkyongensis]|uniref:Cation transport ATPase n=1 Tax=Inhella inkyongensis TaxID=392593 RepID=A0A840S7D1_9BURK|nr:hypothetical protein [Inhella inkyongensis]MBB5204916.1 cation transport ATPase [Inhella inkyongensis]
MSFPLRLAVWGHLLLALLLIVAGALALIFGGSILMMMPPGEMAQRLTWLGALLVLLALLWLGLSVGGAIGLLRGAPWGRTLLMTAAAMELPLLPVGTVLGVYTLWALQRPAFSPDVPAPPA